MAEKLLDDIKIRKFHGVKGQTRRLFDGGGLYFQVTRKGSRSWIYRYEIHNKPRDMGLGTYPRVTLKAAREQRDEARKLRDAGIDPIVARNQQRQIDFNNMTTVMQAAEGFITLHEGEWKTKRYAAQIRARLKQYVEPQIGHLPIATLQLADIELVLQPIWKTIRPTANRIRKHLEDIIDWAINKRIRTDKSNPAEKKRLTSSVSFIKRKVRNYPALSFERAPGFLQEVRAERGVKAKAMEFTMLCGTRIADISGGGKEHSVPMLWPHLDLPGKTWNVPDTKTGKPHVVPLSESAMRLLGTMLRYRAPPETRDPATDFVFPGSKRGTVISAATLRKMIKDMGYAGITTTHGKRATFKTWANETTDFEEKIIDSCLAHAQGEQDAAYHRGSYFDKRRRLMQLWASYLEGDTVQLGATVVALRA